RAGPASRDPRPDQAGQDRRRSDGLPGQPLRRLRALPAADQAEHMAAVERSLRLSGPGARRLDDRAATPAETGRRVVGGRKETRRDAAGRRQNMSLFLFAAITLIGLSVLMLLRPWRGHGAEHEVTAREVNTGIYR